MFFKNMKKEQSHNFVEKEEEIVLSHTSMVTSGKSREHATIENKRDLTDKDSQDEEQQLKVVPEEEEVCKHGYC